MIVITATQSLSLSGETVGRWSAGCGCPAASGSA
jgi:hypothetical protein